MVGHEDPATVEERTCRTRSASGNGSEHELQDGRPWQQEPVIGLVGSLARDVTTLIRQEARLIRVELSEKLDQAKAGVAGTISGMLVTFAGSLFLVAASALALDTQLQRPWLSFLIVGGAVTLIGAILLGLGKRNLATTNLVPERAKESLQQDVKMVKEEIRPRTDRGVRSAV